MESSVFPDFSKRSKTELVTIIDELKHCISDYKKSEGKVLNCLIWDEQYWGIIELDKVKKCLKLAKENYANLDKKNSTSRTDRKAKAFEENIYHIRKIEYCISERKVERVLFFCFSSVVY